MDMDGSVKIVNLSGIETTYNFSELQWWASNNTYITLCLPDSRRRIIPWTVISTLEIVPNSDEYVEWLRNNPEARPPDTIMTCELCHASRSGI